MKTTTESKLRRTFYFNTGVRPNPFAAPPICAHAKFGQIEKGGTIQIPFEVENVPENACLKFLCNYPDLPEGKCSNWIVAKLFPGSGMCSEYAYFQVPAENT